MKEFYRRHLPHWHPKNAVFFVTFCLNDSLPYTVIESLRDDQKRARSALLKVAEAGHLDQKLIDEQRHFEKWDDYLDRAETGPRWLSQPEIADIIKEALRYRDGKVFDLHTFSIMSNHVHVVFEPLSKPAWQPDPSSNLNHQFDLPKLMQSLKRHTARQANITLGRAGPFWQDESYDRVIRNNEEYIRTVNYVLENPVKARLVSRWEDWKWTYCRPAMYE